MARHKQSLLFDQRIKRQGPVNLGWQWLVLEDRSPSLCINGFNLLLRLHQFPNVFVKNIHRRKYTNASCVAPPTLKQFIIVFKQIRKLKFLKGL